MINKILFIRRDNIGDLVCTTPAIAAVRNAFPNAKIGILVNTYNAEIVSNNPDIDEVYVYEKAKHSCKKSKYAVWLSNAHLFLKIRKERYDVAVGCGSYSSRLARYTLLTGAKMRIGYTTKKVKASRCYTTLLSEPIASMHEAERTFGLLTPLGVTSDYSELRVFPSSDSVHRLNSFADSSGGLVQPVIVMHISSRKPENRWPVDNFIILANMLAQRYHTRILLLWSPGNENNVYHPGDDKKAQEIIKALGAKVVGYRTESLSDLIGALSVADLIVCGDGGAMHIAAGLGKPIVALWGSSNADRWRPYRVPHILIQGDNGQANNIQVETVICEVEKLLDEMIS